jgi:hypothetical protein
MAFLQWVNAKIPLVYSSSLGKVGLDLKKIEDILPGNHPRGFSIFRDQREICTPSTRKSFNPLTFLTVVASF